MASRDARNAGVAVMFVQSLIYAVLGTVLGPALGVALFMVMHGAY